MTYIIGAMGVTTALFAWANAYGLGLTYDAYLYLELSKQLHEGHWNAPGLIIKPPLYPLFLGYWSPGYWTLMNGICLAVTTGVMAWMGSFLQCPWWRWGFWLALALATPMYLVHAFLWTEPLFMAVLTMALGAWLQYQHTRRSLWLLPAILFLLLLPGIRLAAWLMILPALLFLTLKHGRRYQQLLFIGLLILLPFGWWSLFPESFVRRSTNLLAPFRGDWVRYLDNADSYLKGLGLWLVPLALPDLLIQLGGIALLLLVVWLVVHYQPKHPVMTLPSVVFLGYYLLLHLVFRVPFYSAERYLAPLYPWLLLNVFWYLDRQAAYRSRSPQRLLLFSFPGGCSIRACVPSKT